MQVISQLPKTTKSSKKIKKTKIQKTKRDTEYAYKHGSKIEDEIIIKCLTVLPTKKHRFIQQLSQFSTWDATYKNRGYEIKEIFGYHGEYTRGPMVGLNKKQLFDEQNEYILNNKLNDFNNTYKIPDKFDKLYFIFKYRYQTSEQIEWYKNKQIERKKYFASKEYHKNFGDDSDEDGSEFILITEFENHDKFKYLEPEFDVNPDDIVYWYHEYDPDFEYLIDRKHKHRDGQLQPTFNIPYSKLKILDEYAIKRIFKNN